MEGRSLKGKPEQRPQVIVEVQWSHKSRTVNSAVTSREQFNFQFQERMAFCPFEPTEVWWP